MAYSLSLKVSISKKIELFLVEAVSRTTHVAGMSEAGGRRDALCPPITTRSPSFLELPTSPRCNHSEVMDRHLGPSHVLSSIIDRSERKK